MKENLNKAMKALRKMGYIALQNHLCCSNCAGCDIANRVEKMDAAKRAKVRGAVYYHAQDAERLRQKGACMLRYGQVDTSAHGEVGIDTVEVGREVVKVLKEHGVGVSWSGDPRECIEININ